MPMVTLNGDGAFDSETTRLLGLAFEAAWNKVETSVAFTNPAEAASLRELLARRLVELARRGERDHDRLVAGILAEGLMSDGTGPGLATHGE